MKPYFEQLVWDVDGKIRLNYATKESGWPTIDLDQTLGAWDDYRAKVVDHYEFDADQVKATEDVARRWEEQLKWYFASNEEDILEYFHGLDRRAANRADPARQNVTSLWRQTETIEAELASARAPWLAQIDDLWASYDSALKAIATPEQLARGPIEIEQTGQKRLDTRLIDRFVPYFDFVVGALLILGLFTRIAAIAGAGFLFSIILTQWPGAPGATPVYYQTIEMLGLLVLAGVAAGQYAGLDFVLNGFWSKFKKTNQGTNS